MDEIQGRTTILCVEDEAELRADLVEELIEAGYDVIEAESGTQAITRTETVRPDLVLCDINMPDLSGYQVLDALRKRPHLADVPFVFLTALAAPSEVIEGKRRGADDYLVKPIDFDLMLVTIEARLRQASAVRQAARHDLEELRRKVSSLGRTATQEAFQTICKTFDHIALGVVVLTGQNRVLFANRAARMISDQGDGLSLNSALEIADAQASRQMTDATKAALSSDSVDSGLPACFSIPRPSGRRDLHALAFPLERGADAKGPAVAIFLSDPESRLPVPDDVLSRLFGFTPAEAQIANLLAEGKRADQIAELLSISPTTVAFHIRNLLGKTGTRRQTDLVALLLTGPMAMSFD